MAGWHGFSGSLKVEIKVLSWAALPSGAWSLFKACVVIDRIQFLMVTGLKSPLSCQLSARGQLLEATCHFLQCDPVHNMAVCPFKSSRRASAATLNVSDVFISDLQTLFLKKTSLIRSGPPTFKGKELQINRVCTPRSRNGGGLSAYQRGNSWIDTFS